MKEKLLGVIDTAIHLFKVGILVAIIISAMLLLLAVYSSPQETHTFTEDKFTVANTTDGAQIFVTYDVTFTKTGDMNEQQEADAIDGLAFASSCSNVQLDSWINSHTEDEVMDTNLNSLTADCHTENIEVSVTSKTVK